MRNVKKNRRKVGTNETVRKSHSNKNPLGKLRLLGGVKIGRFYTSQGPIVDFICSRKNGIQ